MRILFTSVGRRVELMQAFQEAAGRCGIDLLLYGADVSDLAPALYFCDRRLRVCRIDDEAYIPQLLDICRRERIDALIPTIDTDLLLLSRSKAEFEAAGTRAVVSEEESVGLCRDKRLTADLLRRCGLSTPATGDDFKAYDGTYPCFIKPLDGSASINAYKVGSRAELELFANLGFHYIVQPYIEGDEYTVDILCDFDGKFVYITPRRRLAVRGGEVARTQIDLDDRIIAECETLLGHFRLCGAAAVQLIREKRTGTDYFIEINPRFGGGSPLSMKAGADEAGALLRLLCGEPVPYQRRAARDGEAYSRFDQSICIKA
jgi:carbamoyl-phosphate synthase large subunit